MFLVKAVIKKEDMEEVLKSLQDNEFEGITIFEVKGTGSIKQGLKLVDNLQLETVVADLNCVETFIDVLRESCSKWEHGKGKVWWVPVNGIVRIETGERNLEALSSYQKIDIKTSPLLDSLSHNSIDTPCS